MNIKETYQIITFLRFSNPRFYPNAKEHEVEDIVNVWATMFENEDFEIVKQAVKAVVEDTKYPPTIADIKEKIRLLQVPKSMSEMEAWGIVYKAICNSGYDSENQFCKLPGIIQKIVATPKQLREWALTENLNMAVIQSNFMRSYKVMSDREEMISKLPESCKALVSQKQGENNLCLTVKSAEEVDILPM